MPRIFVKRLDVPPSAIDVAGHVNNLEYVRWMQDVAIEHSAEQGWPMARYLEAGVGWYVRSHFVEYLRPAFAGDAVSIATWVAGLGKRSSPRRYLFAREGDGRILVKAETNWVFVDFGTGRAVPIPEEVLSAFEVVPDESEALVALGLDGGRGAR